MERLPLNLDLRITQFFIQEKTSALTKLFKTDPHSSPLFSSRSQPLHGTVCDDPMLSVGVLQPGFHLLGQPATAGHHCASWSLQEVVAQ